MAISGPHCVESQLLSKNWSWNEAYGRDGEDFVSVHRAYDYNAHHAFIVSVNNGDWLHVFPGFAQVLLRWADLSFVEKRTLISPLKSCRSFRRRTPP